MDEETKPEEPIIQETAGVVPDIAPPAALAAIPSAPPSEDGYARLEVLEAKVALLERYLNIPEGAVE